MSSPRHYFLIFSLLFLAVGGTPVGPRKLRILVKCGERHVAHAAVHFHEFDGIHPKTTFNNLLRTTDQHGHYEFESKEELAELEGKNIKLMIKDTCDLDKQQPVNCNLPYHQFHIPFAEIPFHHSLENVLVLNLIDYHHDIHCI
ncbi:hypothetical protein CAEBREN_12255 [Caenorhabditis brenneri]|uniref:Transthyretin-like family protein n=1 Tax=Caenorhabditis brenneri TaxID=135651 RepID=G0NNW8_CAEBE|nr:hypothetical protein CAEBREN_12255 [Caenorhabditis brenneri]